VHSFHAFIDESGDDGFVFLDPPQRASSEWFLVGALLVREANKAAASRELHKLIDPIELARKSPVHFTQLQHDQQVALCFGLAKLPVRTIVVAVNKRKLTDTSLQGKRRLYFYCVRFLIERISWIARDEYVNGQGDGRCRLTFSHCKGLSYSDLATYLENLRLQQQTNVSWPNVDTGAFNVSAHNESLWLRSADIITSGFAKGLELSRHGLCEDRFARLLRPVVYNRNGRFLSYGLKFFPAVPTVEAPLDNRYGWLSQYAN